MEVRVCQSKIEDILYVSKHLRQVDIEEIYLASGSRPYQSLRYGFEKSDLCFTVFVDNEPVGIFGSMKYFLLSDVGSVWFLGTDKMKKIRKTFVKESKRYLEALFDIGVSRLENYVWIENKKSILWLKWLGFVFEEAKEFGKQKALFMKFYKEI